MTQIVVGTEVETWQSEGPSRDYLNGVPYSDRGTTAGRVTNVVAEIVTESHPYYGDSHGKDIPGAGAGDTLYAVVVEYSTGDTFGRDGGQSKVLDFFTDPEEAAALAQRATEHNYGTDGFGFDHNGEHYSTLWCGYFESLDSIDVWDIQIRNKASDISGDKSEWNFRRGH
jgi:hypothetical protein